MIEIFVMFAHNHHYFFGSRQKQLAYLGTVVKRILVVGEVSLYHNRSIDSLIYKARADDI